MDWDDAQDHCKQYVEVIDYGNNEIHEFKDWRLPTYDELELLVNTKMSNRKLWLKCWEVIIIGQHEKIELE